MRNHSTNVIISRSGIFIFLYIQRSKMGWAVQGTYYQLAPHPPYCSLNTGESVQNLLCKSKYWLCGLAKENLFCKWPLTSLLFLKGKEHVCTLACITCPTVSSFLQISKRKVHSNALNLIWIPNTFRFWARWKLCKKGSSPWLACRQSISITLFSDTLHPPNLSRSNYSLTQLFLWVSEMQDSTSCNF